MEDMGVARVFVGLKPPKVVSQLLTMYQKNLQEAIEDRVPSCTLIEGKQSSFVRWTAEDSLHLTLHFIGSVSRQILNRFQSKFREKACELTPFKISLGTMGILPRNRKNMRVVYLGVQDVEKNLESLASLIRSCVVEELELIKELNLDTGTDVRTLSHSPKIDHSQGRIHHIGKLSALHKKKKQEYSGIETDDEGNHSFYNARERDIPFFPHITLGRLEKKAKQEEKDYLASIISKFSMSNTAPLNCSSNTEWVVNSFLFYESVQEGGYSRYKILEEFHF